MPTAGKGITGEKAPKGAWPEVLAVFLRLGLTSFGGPVAHLGYFREEIVTRRRWLDDSSYADLVALRQFLPGPASSQVGIAIGLLRAGYAGAFAAWVGFTLPSALAMVLFAYGTTTLGNAAGSGWLHGLKVAAVAVVSQAVLGMARTLAPDRSRATLAVTATIMALAIPSAWGQIGEILFGGVVGVTLLRSEPQFDQSALPLNVSRTTGAVLLVLFFALLIALPLLVALTSAQGLKEFDAFYRAGSLARALEHVLGRPVDLVQPRAIKNPFMLAGINRWREVIYAS